MALTTSPFDPTTTTAEPTTTTTVTPTTTAAPTTTPVFGPDPTTTTTTAEPGGSLDNETVGTTGYPNECPCPPEGWRKTPDWTVGAITPPACQTTTTTTTTDAPCSGACKWLGNAATGVWTLTENLCSIGCDCEYPPFCPEDCGGDPIAVTYCGRGVPADHGPPPNCPVGGTTTTSPPTTTTTTTTTLPPNCSTPCTWRYAPIVGWRLVIPGCASVCPCPYPSFIPAGPNPCIDTTTPCVAPPPPPTPPPCGGMCQWLWTDSITGWILTSYNCTLGSPGCRCVEPSLPGTVCAQTAFTLCFAPDSPTTHPPTTRPPIGQCTGLCMWCWNGSFWVFQSTNCTSCGCPQPSAPGTSVGEVQAVPCFPTTTSTTTTTTTTTSTTTTTTTTTTSTTCPPGGCTWLCDTLGVWGLVNDPECYLTVPACACQAPDPSLCTPETSGYYVFPCDFGTTTPSPCPGTCLWRMGNTSNWILISHSCATPETCGCFEPGTDPPCGTFETTHCDTGGDTLPGVSEDCTTTTTTTTTTAAPDCPGACTWDCDGFGNWTLIQNLCDLPREGLPITCGCAAPSLICNGSTVGQFDFPCEEQAGSTSSDFIPPALAPTADISAVVTIHPPPAGKPLSRRAVVTSDGGGRWGTDLQQTIAGYRAYARRHGADLRIITHADYGCPEFSRFRLGGYLRRYDEVVYVDPWVALTAATPDLFALAAPGKPTGRIGVVVAHRANAARFDPPPGLLRCGPTAFIDWWPQPADPFPF